MTSLRSPAKPDKGGWSGKRGSNPRPSRWQRDALPLSYSRKMLERKKYIIRPRSLQVEYLNEIHQRC